MVKGNAMTTIHGTEWMQLGYWVKISLLGLLNQK
jgi:hypothetical protein